MREEWGDRKILTKLTGWRLRRRMAWVFLSQVINPYYRFRKWRDMKHEYYTFMKHTIFFMYEHPERFTNIMDGETPGKDEREFLALLSEKREPTKDIVIRIGFNKKDFMKNGTIIDPFYSEIPWTLKKLMLNLLPIWWRDSVRKRHEALVKQTQKEKIVKKMDYVWKINEMDGIMDSIEKKNKALLYSKDDNYIVREHAKRILKES